MTGLFGQAEGEGGAVRDASDAACFVRVAVERGIESAGRGAGKEVDAALTYAADEVIEVGERVEVPLGRGNTKTAGMVVEVGGAELAQGFDLKRIKWVSGRTGVALPGELVELAKWMAWYYVCPLGMVLATMLPGAVKQGTGRRTRKVVVRAEDVSEEMAAELGKATRAAWEKLEHVEFDEGMSARVLADAIKAKTVGPINRLVRAGLLVEKEVEEVHSRLGGWEDMLAPPHSQSSSGRVLTDEQQRAVDGILTSHSNDAEGAAVHLLHGITGSGKTEVYLRALERVVAQGKGGVIMVPEIALTPQTAERFVERFRDVGVAVLHSGLSGAQRNREWTRLATATARVAVGARSAVFAPVNNLGLIVVDEEHDSSYKQDQLPRYSGRDVAVVRASMAGCPVVLGSATPSLESWANAKNGKYTLWPLTQRVGGGTLPEVRIVDIARERKDMAQQRIKGAANRQIGLRLEKAMHETLDAGGQMVLMLNRRGWASVVMCPSARCGWVMHCSRCDVAMVEHRKVSRAKAGYLKCHHCLSEDARPVECPACGSRLREGNAGTQRLEDEVMTLMGERHGLTLGESVVRVDSDAMHSAGGKGGFFKTMRRFASGHVRVLLGTQMIAKGLDVANVRLVGVINADTALGLADFRSAERTFQLIAQVAGRAGRGEHAGRVIVQTLSPEHEAITAASAHDYERFAADEMHVRIDSGLPPATRMARIVVRDQKREDAEHRARKLRELLAAELREVLLDVERNGHRGESGEVWPVSPCAIERVADWYRFEIIMVARSRSIIQKVLGAVRSKGELTSDIKTAVDVDPVTLM